MMQPMLTVKKKFQAIPFTQQHTNQPFLITNTLQASSQLWACVCSHPYPHSFTKLHSLQYQHFCKQHQLQKQHSLSLHSKRLEQVPSRRSSLPPLASSFCGCHHAHGKDLPTPSPPPPPNPTVLPTHNISFSPHCAEFSLNKMTVMVGILTDVNKTKQKLIKNTPPTHSSKNWVLMQIKHFHKYDRLLVSSAFEHVSASNSRSDGLVEGKDFQICTMDTGNLCMQSREFGLLSQYC